MSTHHKKIRSLEYQVLYFSQLYGVNSNVKKSNTTMGENFDDWLTFIVPNEHYYLLSSRKNPFEYLVLPTFL